MINDDRTIVEGQYVVFRLGKNNYGINISHVLAIEKIIYITRVPRAYEYIKGVINFRGEVIFVIDLAARFNFGRVEYSSESRIIVINIGGEKVGALVSEVDEVFDIHQNEIENGVGSNREVDLIYVDVSQKGEVRNIALFDVWQLLTIK